MNFYLHNNNMRHIKISIIIVAILASSAAMAQSSYSRWALGFNGGLGMDMGDAESSTSGFAYGITGKYSITNRLALRYQYTSTSFDIHVNTQYYPGAPTVSGWDANIEVIDHTFQLIFNAINFRKGRADKNGVHPIFSVMYLGIGFGNFDNTVTKGGKITNANIDNLMVGTLGLKLKLSRSIDLTSEYSVRKTGIDNFDGYSPAIYGNRADDYYGIASVGLHLNFGGPNGNIEMTTGYEDVLKKMNKKVEMSTKELQANYDELKKKLEGFESLRIDGDSDGVSDYYDKEPNSPSNQVNQSGITLDSDRDGIPNYLDKCPTEAGTVPDGCKMIQYVKPQGNSNKPESKLNKERRAKMKKDNKNKAEAEKTEEKKIVVVEVKPSSFKLKKAEFKPGSIIVITSESYNELNRILRLMKKHENFKLVVEGYSDSLSTNESAIKHSISRAEFVKAYMVVRGISIDRISTKGFVISKSKKSKKDKHENRSVELRFE